MHDSSNHNKTLKKYKCGDLFFFCPNTFRIFFGKKEIRISHKEAAILTILCENHMRVVERKTLLSIVWKDSEGADSNLNKNILLLRRKFESIGLNQAIETIPRVGYVLKLDIETVISDCTLQQKIGYDTTLKTKEVKSYKKFINRFRNRHLLFLFLLLTSMLYFFSSNLTQWDAKPLSLLVGIKKFDNSEEDRVILYTTDAPPLLNILNSQAI